jgi:hypothetical protein
MDKQTPLESLKTGFFFGVGGVIGSIVVWGLLGLILTSTASKPTSRAAANKTAAPCERV